MAEKQFPLWLLKVRAYPRLENPCMLQKDHCLNCQSHFMKIRPLLKAAFFSRHFIKYMKGEEAARSIVSDILYCSNVDYYELHKFEENIDGYLIFRAKKEGTHIVYCVDREMQLFFLRAFRNYREYESFLDDKRGVRRLVSHAFNEGENEI